jgi:hypothetical protein
MSTWSGSRVKKCLLKHCTPSFSFHAHIRRCIRNYNLPLPKSIEGICLIRKRVRLVTCDRRNMIRLLCQHHDLQQRWRKLVLHRSARSHSICNCQSWWQQPGGRYPVHSLRSVGTRSLFPISPSRLHFPRAWPPTNLLVLWPSRRNESLTVISQTHLSLMLCLIGGLSLRRRMVEYRRSAGTLWLANLSNSPDQDHRYMAEISVKSR